jgi:hypothetical protein
MKEYTSIRSNALPVLCEARVSPPLVLELSARDEIVRGNVLIGFVG